MPLPHGKHILPWKSIRAGNPAGWLGNQWTVTLVGGFNPFEKYACQIGSFPQAGVKIKNVWNHHPVTWLIILFVRIPREDVESQNYVTSCFWKGSGWDLHSCLQQDLFIYISNLYKVTYLWYGIWDVKIMYPKTLDGLEHWNTSQIPGFCLASPLHSGGAGWELHLPALS